MTKIFYSLFFISLNLFSDTLILTTGEYFKGKAITQNAKEIIFKGEDGKNSTYSKQTVLRVFYRDMTESEVQDAINKENKDPSKVPVKAKKFTVEDDSYKGNRWSPVWRSAILPGWGQWYGKQKILGLGIGFVFFGAVSFLGSSYADLNSNLQKKEIADRNGSIILFSNLSLSNLGTVYATQQLIANESKKAEQEYQQSIGNVLVGLGVVVFVYSIQLVQSMVLGNKLVKERDSRLKKLNETGFKFNSHLERFSSIENNQLNTVFTFQYTISL
jgi:hypothetical protein